MTKSGCDYAVHVRINVEAPAKRPLGKPITTGLRHFIVEYNSDGNVIRIKERRPLPPPSVGVYNAQHWVASHHGLGNGDTLVKRIIAAAQAKVEAEQRAADATP